MLTPITPITNWVDRPPMQQVILAKNQINQKMNQVDFYNRLYDCYVKCTSNVSADKDEDKRSCNTFALYG